MRNLNAAISDPNSFVTCSGSSEKEVYSAVVKTDGSIAVEVSGKEDFQGQIESFRNQTDMAYIIKQLQLGNSDVLVKSIGQYGDFTAMPKSMAEAMQLQIDAEREFYKLDLDTRNKFNNDFRYWLMTCGSSEWMKNMNFESTENSTKGEEAQEVKE